MYHVVRHAAMKKVGQKWIQQSVNFEVFKDNRLYLRTYDGQHLTRAHARKIVKILNGKL